MKKIFPFYAMYFDPILKIDIKESVSEMLNGIQPKSKKHRRTPKHQSKKKKRK